MTPTKKEQSNPNSNSKSNALPLPMVVPTTTTTTTRMSTMAIHTNNNPHNPMIPPIATIKIDPKEAARRQAAARAYALNAQSKQKHTSSSNNNSTSTSSTSNSSQTSSTVTQKRNNGTINFAYPPVTKNTASTASNSNSNSNSRRTLLTATKIDANADATFNTSIPVTNPVITHNKAVRTLNPQFIPTTTTNNNTITTTTQNQQQTNNNNNNNNIQSIPQSFHSPMKTNITMNNQNQYNQYQLELQQKQKEQQLKYITELSNKIDDEEYIKFVQGLWMDSGNSNGNSNNNVGEMSMSANITSNSQSSANYNDTREKSNTNNCTAAATTTTGNNSDAVLSMSNVKVEEGDTTTTNNTIISTHPVNHNNSSEEIILKEKIHDQNNNDDDDDDEEYHQMDEDEDEEDEEDDDDDDDDDDAEDEDDNKNQKKTDTTTNNTKPNENKSLQQVTGSTSGSILSSSASSSNLIHPTTTTTTTTNFDALDDFEIDHEALEQELGSLLEEDMEAAVNSLLFNHSVFDHNNMIIDGSCSLPSLGPLTLPGTPLTQNIGDTSSGNNNIMSMNAMSTPRLKNQVTSRSTTTTNSITTSTSSPTNQSSGIHDQDGIRSPPNNVKSKEGSLSKLMPPISPMKHTSTTKTTAATTTANTASSSSSSSSTHPIPTEEQVLKLHKLMKDHYQILLQQAVLAVRAAHGNKYHKDTDNTISSTSNYTPYTYLSPQHNNNNNNNNNMASTNNQTAIQNVMYQRSQPHQFNEMKRKKHHEFFFCGETADDLSMILDGAVTMLQDLDHNRKDAIRYSIQMSNMRRKKRKLDLGSGTNGFYSTVVNSTDNNTIEDNNDEDEDNDAEEVRGRLTRSAFSRTLQENKWGGDGRILEHEDPNQKSNLSSGGFSNSSAFSLEANTTFGVMGLARLDQTFAAIDNSLNAAVGGTAFGGIDIFDDPDVSSNTMNCAYIFGHENSVELCI